MKKRAKKYDATKAAKQRVVGLTVSWCDESPLMDSSGFMPGTVSHKRPLLRALAPALYSRNKDWIVNQQPFHWKISITVIFKYGNGTDQRETRELFAHAVLSDISSHCEDQFLDAMRHGQKELYSHTEFIVECLGDKRVDVEAVA